MQFKAQELNFFDFFRLKQKIPFHQRPYVWEFKDLQDFWEDLVYVEDNSNNNAQHFLGSIVTSNQTPTESRIIDGQQRVTSYIIFALALYKKAINILDAEEIKTKNPSQTDAEWTKYKQDRLRSKKELWASLENIIQWSSYDQIWSLMLIPSKKDKSGFNKIIDSINDLSPQNQLEKFSDPDDASVSRVSGAFDDVCKLIDVYLKEDVTNEFEKVGKLALLIEKLTHNFKFVNVQISDGDPTKVFENLNTKGQPLSTIDIIKNSIFQDLDQDDAEEFERELNDSWVGFENNLTHPIKKLTLDDSAKVIKQFKHIAGYWFPFSTTLTPNISNKTLNSQLKDCLDNATEVTEEGLTTAKKKVEILGKYVYLYNALTLDHYDEKAKKLPKEIKNQLKHFFRMKCPTMVFSFIFQSIDYYINLPDDQENHEVKLEIIESFKLIQNRIMRASMLKSASQAPKDIHLPLFNEIKNNGYNFKLVRHFLESNSYPFPKDKEIEDSFKNNELYGVSRLRYFLEEYEIYKSDLTESQLKVFLNGQYNQDELACEVDHLMPQKGDKWKSSLTKEYTKKEYEQLVHKIGNCFLLDKSLNLKKSNKSFEEAKEIIDKDKNYYGKFISTRREWTDRDIRTNCDTYFQFFIKRWPEPKEIMRPIEEDKDKTLNTAIEKFNDLFLEENVSPTYYYVSFNKFHRNDFNLTKSLKDLIEKITSISKTKNTAINLHFLTPQADIKIRKMNIYNVRASSVNRDEILFSISRLKEITAPTEVLAFFVENSKLYCINITDSGKSKFKKILSLR